LLQAVISVSTGEGWRLLRASVEIRPLIFNGAVEPRHIAWYVHTFLPGFKLLPILTIDSRLIHPAPPYLKKVLVQLLLMFDPKEGNAMPPLTISLDLSSRKHR
jgi:hypothetical protein